jgi:Flp pilus assembly protein TadG
MLRVFGGESSAQALVEFALASIVFFTTMLGTISFGLAIWQYDMVSSLAQEGARWASVRGSSSSSPASSANVQTYVQTRSPGFTVSVSTSAAPSSLSAGSTLTVTVQTTFFPLTSLVPVGSMTLSSTAQMIMQR